jgi:hypothetical protein
MLEQQYINVGATANDGQGDPLRVAFEKINNNFTQLYQTGTSTSSAYSVGDTAGQVIFEVSTDLFSQGTFQIRSNNTENSDSQGTTVSGQITTDNLDVKYTVYGATYNGDALTQFSMDVANGNVRLMADPLLDVTMFHFIASQVTYIGPVVQTMALSLEDNPSNVLATQNNFNLATEQV